MIGGMLTGHNITGVSEHTTKKCGKQGSWRALDGLRLHDQSLTNGVVAKQHLQRLLSQFLVRAVVLFGVQDVLGLDKHPSGMLQ